MTVRNELRCTFGIGKVVKIVGERECTVLLEGDALQLQSTRIRDLASVSSAWVNT